MEMSVETCLKGLTFFVEKSSAKYSRHENWPERHASGPYMTIDVLQHGVPRYLFRSLPQQKSQRYRKKDSLPSETNAKKADFPLRLLHHWSQFGKTAFFYTFLLFSEKGQPSFVFAVA
jgi:hypothetical protein